MPQEYSLALKSDIEAINREMAAGSLDKAMAMTEALLTKEPSLPSAWYLKGFILRQQNQRQQAIPCFNQALTLQSDFREACIALARTLEETGHLLTAIKVYEHLLAIELSVSVPKTASPLNPAIIKESEQWFHQGVACQRQGDLEGAAQAFRSVLALCPDMPEALTNLGMALFCLRDYPQAIQVLLHCLRIKRGFTPALNILGGCYGASGEPLMAIAVWRQIVAIDMQHLEGWLNLAKELSRLECLDDAIKAFEQVLRIQPADSEAIANLLHMLSSLCRWERLQEIRKIQPNKTGKKHWMEPFFVCIHLPEKQPENARQFAQNFYPAGKPYDLRRALPAATRENKKLHIGYLSSDFHQHATAYLISELFEKHDRNHFQIYGYSHGPANGGAAKMRIKNAVDQFHDISETNDLEAAELIQSHGIDILVDLKGYTRGHRLSLMSLRPAALQLHYLGFPGTTGANFIDYFISDPIASPEGSDALFSESLIRLPHSYQINDRSRPLPQSAQPRSAYGLPEQGLVFCAFNSAYKITPELFAVWMRLLQAVEGSVLWLYEGHPEAIHHMKAAAQKQGIDPARLIPAKSLPLVEHLARYHHADLFLDTFPCGGHTTVSDALWCAVPVITMAGSPFISRVAASLLHAVNLPELVTNDLAAYESLALAVAKDEKKRLSLKLHLEEGRLRFPLFDSKATTRAIEKAYRHIAEQHLEGKSPQAFSIPAETTPT